MLLAQGRSTDRSTIGRAELLCRSTERSTDMHQSALCTIHSSDCKRFALSWIRSTAPVDRQRALLPSWEKRSTDRSTAIANGRKSNRWRSTGRRISFKFFPNGYILFYLFLGLFSTTLLGFSPHIFIPYK